MVGKSARRGGYLWGTATETGRWQGMVATIRDMEVIGKPFGASLSTQHNPDPDTLVVSGLLVELADWISSECQRISIYAHVVRVAGSLKTHGAHSIMICARYVVFDPDASIDVSGNPGRVPEPWKAGRGAAGHGREAINGGSGEDGVDGGPGENGGTIRIVAEQIIGLPTLAARGGPGGRGQHGGDGGSGDVVPPTQVGNGGNGGKAGQRGRHGDGGTICVETVVPCRSCGNLDVSGGGNSPSDPEARGGDPGPGGWLILLQPSARHPAGTSHRFVAQGGHVTVMVWSSSHTGAGRKREGGSGRGGDPPSQAPRGEMGTITLKRITYADLGASLAVQTSQANYWSPDRSLISMVLLAGVQFVVDADPKQDMEPLRDVLNYLLRITSGATTPVMQAIREQCLVILSRRLTTDPSEIADQRITGYLFETQLQTQYSPDPETLVVSGLDVKLGDWTSGAFKRISIYGHIVRVAGQLRTGHAVDFSLFARYAVFAPGASLDVSGQAGKGKEHKGKPNPGEGGKNLGDPGQQGPGGEPGEKGENGGSIRIVAEQVIGDPFLVANGGPGGRGQDGGDGGAGARGADGLNQKVGSVPRSRYRVKRYIKQHATPGRPGGGGGKGGTGGQRGKNGDGGMLTLETVFPFKSARLQASPGQDFVDPKTEARCGAGGPGGEGGRGGILLVEPSNPYREKSGRCPDGPKGLQGQAGDPPAQAEEGRAGIIAQNPTTFAELGRNLAQQVSHAGYSSEDSSLVSMALLGTERLYLNATCDEDVDAVRDVLSYLLRVTAYAATPKLQAIHQRCEVLRLNLERGLDYFGRLPNSVPSLSFEENRLFYRDYVEVARDLERDYDVFWDKQESEGKKRAALVAQASKVRDFAAKQLKPQLPKLDTSIRGFHDSVNSIAVQMEVKEKEILASSEEFQEALCRRLRCKTMLAILNVVVSVVQLGFNAKSLFSGGIKALTELFPTEDDKGKGKGKKADSTIIKDVVKVKGNVQSIMKGFDALKEIRKQQGRDAAKLVTKKEEFDEMMKEYLDIPQAKPYIKTVHEYIDLASQRNTAIANHDAACIEWDNIQRQIILAEEEAAELETQLLIDANPLRPVFVQYMSRTLQLVKSLVIETLYRMARSLEYYSLAGIPIRFVDYRISTLESQYAYLLSELNRAKEERGARSRFRRRVVIEDQTQLDSLRQGQPIWFFLPLNKNRPATPPFASVQCPMVEGVQCLLEGVSSPGPEGTATVTIQHCGVSTMYNEQNDSVWTFVHAPRTVSFEYALASGKYEEGQGDLTEGDQFMMLSPFAVWGLQIRPEDGMNSALDLAGLNKVTVTFRGRGAVSPIRRGLAMRRLSPAGDTRPTR